MTAFRPVIVVPHYNHVRQFAGLLERLEQCELPLIVVDDGSEAGQLGALEELSAKRSVTLIRHGENRGKGAAVMTGFVAAADRGFSHAFQIDADGQHDVNDIPRFVAEAESFPDAIICGAPVFGDDAPFVRRWGRKLTDGVVFLETWTRGIRDSLCGFRIYPLSSIVPLIRTDRPGDRMDFDAEMLVLALWNGISLRFLDTRVIYPPEGVSHFRYVPDNARMVLMHTRLLLRMILRSPKLAADKVQGRMGVIR